MFYFKKEICICLNIVYKVVIEMNTWSNHLVNCKQGGAGVSLLIQRRGVCITSRIRMTVSRGF